MDKVCCYLHPNAELYDDYRTGDVICTICGLVILDRILEPYENNLTYKEENYDNFPNPKYILNIPSFLLEIAEKSHLTDSIIKTAVEIYEKINVLKCLKKISSEICCTVALFTACRKAGAPRTFAEISNSSNVPVKTICKYYKIVSNEIEEFKAIKFINNAGLITRATTSLNLSYMIEKEAEIKYEELKAKFPNKSPNTLIAASIYLASLNNNKKISIENIANFIDIHPITLAHFLRIINNNQS